VTSSSAVFEVPIRAKSMYMKKSWLNTRTKKKISKATKFCHQSLSKNCLEKEFIACQVERMTEGALTSFIVCDAYRYFVGEAQLLTW